MNEEPLVVQGDGSGLLRRLDLLLAGTGAAVAATQMVRGVINESIVSLLLGVLLFFPCATWLFMRSYEQSTPEFPYSRKTLFSLSFIGFWVFFTVGNLMLYNQADAYQRSLGYLISVALMAGMLVCEMLCSSRRTPWIILPQIVLLGVSVSWSQVVNFSGVVGMDPWFHQMFTNLLIENHYLPLDYNYAHFPLFHLLVGQTMVLTGLEYKVAALLSVSLVQIVCNVLFVYLFAVTIFRRQKVGTLASLMVVLAPYHIYMSYWSIPNAFAAVFIVIALYLLFRRRDGSRVFFVLIGLIFGTLILTHTISALCMAIVLFTAWGAFHIYRMLYGRNCRNYVPLSIPVIFTIVMLAWWCLDMVTVGTFHALLMESFDFYYFHTAPAPLIGYTLASPLEVAYNDLGLFLPLFFSLTGIFAMISMKSTPRRFIAAFIGLAPFAITIAAFLFGIAIIPDRWFYFSEILLGGPLAFGILLAGRHWGNRRMIISFTIPVLIVIVFAFLAITNPIADHWDPLISPNNTRNALFESEINAFHTVASVSPSPIKTDMYYAESQKWGHTTTIPFDNEIYSHNFSGLSGSPVLVRDTVQDGPFTLYSVAYTLGYSLNSDLTRAGFSRVYDSWTVKGYLLPREQESGAFSGVALPVTR